MSSRKEDEKNEKIIRGLMKLPPNRKCINCNSLGPQYVCTNFWTFVCITCSGIHREFTHRVKSVSMAKFTSQEVESLQRGGNQRAREIFLKDWDVQLQRLPDSSNPDKIREFIKSVYVERKYAGSNSADKPPRDTQINKKIEEDHRRASSYHSFSQSPPYDHQYEDRFYGKHGKQPGILSRKPGSDRVHYDGKVSSFVDSPGRMVDHTFEDQSANEGSSTRTSDFSASSTGNPFSFDSRCTDFHCSSGYCSPPVSDLLDGVRALENSRTEVDGQSHPQETVSSGSLGSVNGPEKSSGTQFIGTAIPDLFSLAPVELLVTSSAPRTDLSAEMTKENKTLSPPIDFFADVNRWIPDKTSAPTVDFFAGMNHQNTVFTGGKSSSVSLTENEKWATFDLPNEAVLAPKKNQEAPPTASSVQTSTHPRSFSLITDQFHGQALDTNGANGPKIYQTWNAFDDSAEKLPEDSKKNFLQTTETGDLFPMLITSNDHHQCKSTSEVWNAFGDSTGDLPQTSIPNSLQKSESLDATHKAASFGRIDPQDNSLEDYIKSAFERSKLEDGCCSTALPLGCVVKESSFPSSILPSMDKVSGVQKSINPFDLPFDSDPEPEKTLWSMSILQSALPSPPLPTGYLDGLSEPWFLRSSVSPFVPVTNNGGATCMPAQEPSSPLQSLSSQDPVASFSGNPFV